MQQGIPLHGELNPFCSEQGDGHITRPFDETNVADGIGPTPEMNMDLSNSTGDRSGSDPASD